MTAWTDRLRESAKACGNIACMGLDPVVSLLPESGNGAYGCITGYFGELFSAMKAKGLVPSAFKPNLGYYSALDRPLEDDFSGSRALAAVLKMLRETFPETPVILDSKRGDIARSSLNYANEAFGSWRADAVTVSPYMGDDSVNPFFFEGKGVYVLNRTSNPGAASLQNRGMEGGGKLYNAVVGKISEWHDEFPGVGAVVGATSLPELEDILSSYAKSDVPVLIPGVGSQGGSAEDVLAIISKVGYDARLARINSSSGLTHPWGKSGKVPGGVRECVAAAVEKIAALIGKCRV